MIKRLAGYYKPHMTLFLLDLAAAFFVGMADQFMPMIVRTMINVYVPDRNYQMMLRWCIGLAVIYLIKLMLNLFINYWGHICGVRIQADMRRELFRHMEKLPVSYFDANKTGTIMSRIINDLQEISEMAHHGPENIFIIAVMLVVSFVMLTTINLKLTLIVFCCLPAAVIFSVMMRQKQLDAFAQNRVKIGEINAKVETSIAGVRVTKAYNAKETEYRKFDAANEEYKEARRISYKYMSLFNSGMNFFTDLMYLVVIIAGGYFFMSGEINSGDFVAYILYISTFLTPIKKFVDTYEQIAEGMSGFRRYCAIMDVPEEMDEPDAVDVGRLHGEIDFTGVTFHYGDDENSRDVISDMTLHIRSGSTVALVGPSGGGKTTICNLIPRFYEVDSGTISIDGMDIRHMTRESLRRNIGIVAQDVFLFAGTIRDNIAYGTPDATDEQVIEAAREAEIHDYIMSLPQGYDTYVGERGMRLSGGQRQRISIARVFLKNPEILILDEATSALDNATEMQIQKSLDRLSEGRTVLVVAHRLSTIRGADEIVVISDRGILEHGSREELLAAKGEYYRLHTYQFAAED